MPLPAFLRDRLEVLERDVRTVANDLVGRRPAPFERRAPLFRHGHVIVPVQPELLAARTVRIARVVRETDSASTLHLEDPSGAAIRFVPGQFLTLLVDIGGEKVRRAYSICTGLDEGAATVAVTVKRVAGGRVSNHLNDLAKPGDLLQVLGPSGSFVVEPDPARQRRLVLIGGGSGITPLMSIARSVLAKEPRSHVTLVYGNRAQKDVIFHDALVALAAAHPDRFSLRLVLEDCGSEWTGGRGVLDRETCVAELARILDGEIGEGGEPEFFVCGPEPMMAAAREAILARGVDPARVHEERFSSPAQRSSGPRAIRPQPVQIRFRGGSKTVTPKTEETLLEAGLAAGAPMPFSCAMGGCGACKVKLVEGEVHTEEPNCLTAAERGEGFILACVSHAATPCTIQIGGQLPGEVG
jgi:ferredoxin-NADP reductase